MIPYNSKKFPFKLYEDFLDVKAQDYFFYKILEDTKWEEGELTIFGKTYKIPRLQAWYGDKGVMYSYSGMELDSSLWTKELKKIKEKVEILSGYKFNSALLNLYRKGSDSNGWHRDNEKELGSDPVIASVSLGQSRLFKVRDRHSKKVYNIILKPGSLLLMTSGSQLYWDHCLPKTQKEINTRINITFRWVNQLT